MEQEIPVMERYALLPKGIFYQFFQKIGYPLLFIGLIINFHLIRRKNIPLKSAYTWVLIFSALYILLLPMGGYREYRENILRYDTILPITIAFIFLFSLGSVAILQLLKNQTKVLYVSFLILFSLVYLNADRLKTKEYHCQKAALFELSQANQDVVTLSQDCTVLSWEPILSSDESTTNAKMLWIWGVTDTPRLYKNQNPQEP